MLHKVVLTFASVGEILTRAGIQMKASAQYFSGMLYIMLHKL